MTEANHGKKRGGMPFLTDLAMMIRIDQLALVIGLRVFANGVYGPVMSHVFPDVQAKLYSNSVLYVNLVSVVDYSVLKWGRAVGAEGRLAIDDWLFGRVPACSKAYIHVKEK